LNRYKGKVLKSGMVALRRKPDKLLRSNSLPVPKGVLSLVYDESMDDQTLVEEDEKLLENTFFMRRMELRQRVSEVSIAVTY
jgi:hypothetical protein